MIINIAINQIVMEDIIKYLQKDEEIENNIKEVLYISKYLNIQKIMEYCYMKIIKQIKQKICIEQYKDILDNENYKIQILKMKYKDKHIKYGKKIKIEKKMMKKMLDSDM